MSKGVIAAGSRAAIDAGTEILQLGGNAVDAVVAACFAVSAGEPSLTSLAGGGVMLHRDGATGAVSICDFFANAPGLAGVAPTEPDHKTVEIDFGPTTQRFHVGAATAAVPGTIPGLCAAAEKWGRLPLAAIVAPAARMLREGVPLEEMAEWVNRLLSPILDLHETPSSPFFVDGRAIRAGERFRNSPLADTLERLADLGWREYGRSILDPLLLEHCGVAAGGMLGPEDLDHYQVEFRRPLRLEFEGCRVSTNPLPAAGGAMIALILDLLEGRPHPESKPGSIGRVRNLSVAMKVADEARASGRPFLEELPRWRERFHEALEQPLASSGTEPKGPGSTTHVGVIDAEGNCAAVTFTYGEGNGQILGETGILMNNLLGEEDLFVDGLGVWPAGERLATMMAPTLIEAPDGAVHLLGGGGSNRIRTATAQVLLHLLHDGFAITEAVSAPRIHYEAGVLNLEKLGVLHGSDFRALGPEKLVEFDTPSMFFGGIHVATLRKDGTMLGAGDPRRGGRHAIVDGEETH